MGNRGKGRAYSDGAACLCFARAAKALSGRVGVLGCFFGARLIVLEADYVVVGEVEGVGG